MLQSETCSRLSLEWLGLKPYAEVWDLQRQIQAALIAGRGKDTVLLCEHQPVITLGRRADRGNVLLDDDALKKNGISLYEVERGGDVTYHGPGQLVCYPILDLRRKRQDVGWYMRLLEEVIIQTLKSYGVIGFRVKGKPGVWVGSEQAPRKIASIGVRLSHWCTLHGFSLNVLNCSKGFACIHPCGFRDIIISSIEEETGKIFRVAEVQETAARCFINAYHC